MRGTFRIGRILGIPITVNPSWFLILLFVIGTLATQAFPEELRRQPAWVHWLLAVGSALVLFASMVAHELAHSVVARHFGIPVRNITLFVLGAVAQTTRESRRASHEFLMAAAGPAASILIAGVFLLLWFLADKVAATLALAFGWLAFANLAVGIFNLLPAYPMDGGRVLRSALWGISGSQRRATHWAALVGRGFAWLLFAAGVATMVRAPWFSDLSPVNGVQFIFIGLFINFAARQSDAHSGMLDGLSRYRARDIMLRGLTAVLADLPVREALTGPLSGYGPTREWLLVSDGGRFLGLTQRGLLQALPEERWDTTRVGELMIPVARLQAAAPDEPVSELLQRMQADDSAVVAVVEDGQVAGIVHRGMIAGLTGREA